MIVMIPSASESVIINPMRLPHFGDLQYIILPLFGIILLYQTPMLQLGDRPLHNDRKHSDSGLSVAKSSSTDTNSSKQDHGSIIDANQEANSRPRHPRSFTSKPTPVQLHQPTNKEKSQLCRKYIDTGSCPYGFRCKFAHGAHELRQNQQVNSRYKTKECGTFFREGYCRFGNRCNFLHTKTNNEALKKATLVKIMGNHRECVHEMRGESRLLKLLALGQQ